MVNGIESKPVEHIGLPRESRYHDQSSMRNLHTVAVGKVPRSTKRPRSLCRSLDHRLWDRKESNGEIVAYFVETIDFQPYYFASVEGMAQGISSSP